jgi:hypothetical protein
MTFEKTIGTRAEVYKGIAAKTSYGKGGLGRGDIVFDPKDGRYKSKYKTEHVPEQLRVWNEVTGDMMKKKQKPGKPAVMIKGKIASAARKEFKKVYGS